MAAIDLKKVPKFARLPVKQGAPADSSWGVFGDGDNVGCLNFLTAAGVVEAAKLVKKGRVFRLDTPINYARPPLFARRPAAHHIISFRSAGLLGFDDSLDNYNTQEGSQWDGLSHIGNPDTQRFYNGVREEEIKDGPDGRLGIHHWANRVVGRGVLADLAKYRSEKKRPLNPLAREAYTLEDLTGALERQKAKLKPGTILLLRTGWMKAYLAASPEDRAAMAPIEGLKACGIESTRELMELLWDNRVAAVGTDCPAVEPWPWDFRDNGSLHSRALSLLGLPIGEQFMLDELAADCHKDKRYEFMVVSVPLHLEGGIASPPNIVAIK